MSTSHSTPSTSSDSSLTPNHPDHPNLSAEMINQASQFAAAVVASGSGMNASHFRLRIPTPRSTKKRGPGSRHEPPSFTTSMQDAQARNKDPYESSEESSDDGGWSGRRFDAYGNDSYENTQKRRMAAVILDSPELLMMHSQARCDSIAATRHYFTKLLCGFLDEKDTYPVDGQLPDKEKEKSRDRERDRNRRQVSGQGSRR